MTNPSKKSLIKDAAWDIFETTGRLPSRQDITGAIGGGSARDINAELAEWKKDLADWVFNQRHHPDMPDAVINGIKDIWDEAINLADAGARERLKAEVLAVEEREAVAKESVAQARDEASEAVNTLNAALSENKVLSSQVDRAETQYKESSAALATATENVARLKNETLNLTNEAERLRQAREQMKADCDQEMSQQRQRHEKDEERWAGLIDQAREREKTEVAHAKSLSDELADVKSEIVDLKREHALEVSALRGEVETWKGRYESQTNILRKEIDTHKANADTLSGEVTELEQATGKLKDDNHEMRIDAQSTKKVILSLETQLVHQQEQYDDLMKTFNKAIESKNDNGKKNHKDK